MPAKIQTRRSSWLVALALCTACAKAQAPASPDEGRTIFREVAPTVVLDITVADQLGHPVTGLASKDFEILENGARQVVASFEEHPALQAAAPRQPRPSEPPNVFSNTLATPLPDAVDVLLLDSLNTPMLDQAFVRKQAILYLKRMPPSAHVAIFWMSTRLVFVQGFTSDAAVLLAALGEKETNPQFSPLLKTRGDDAAEQQTISRMESLAAGPGSSALQASIAAMEQFLDERDNSQTGGRADITLRNLGELGRYLAAIPGRKNVMWFSGSFPASIYPGQASKDAMPRFYYEQIKKTAELLAAARVAIYPIDARGLQTSAFYDASLPSAPNPGVPASQQLGVSLQLESIQRAAEHATMDELALRTGGRAFYNSNGLKDAMNTVVESGSRFYTLTYAPSNRKMDGEFRKVTVKVRKGRYVLGYRRGYYATPPQEALTGSAAQLSDPLSTFMGLGMPRSDQIGYKVLVVPTKGSSEAQEAPGTGRLQAVDAEYHVNFAVPVGYLTFTLSSDGVRHCAIELSLAAYDRYGEPVSATSKWIDLALDQSQYAYSERNGVQIHEAIRLPKGNLWLRAGIFDRASARVGTIEIPMSEVVDRASGR